MRKAVSKKSMKSLLFLLLTAMAPALPAETATKRPNIIVIMTDDMGYSDLGCYGGEIETPHLDRLAANGLRYTQFYNTGRCCPTRASLLTGLYAHQAGIGQMTNDLGQPGYRGNLSFHAVTLAEALKPAGYRTYMSGKWHVTTQLKPDGDKANWPRQRGFDRFYGTIIGAGSFYDPWTLTRENDAITPANDPVYQPKRFHYTEAISDNAVMFTKEHAEKHSSVPFFLYVAYTAPHWPLHAFPEDMEKCKGRYDAGYAAIRSARLERMKKMGLVPPDGELSPMRQRWEDVKPEHLAWEIRCMETYAAMIHAMDRGIGRIIASLEAGGQLNNTLVLFLHDNGGCAEQYGRKPLTDSVDGIVPMKKDELQTNMIPIRSREGLPVLTGPGVMPGPADTYIAYGPGWANVSNTPFRLFKSNNHEGGIATPLIAHWPMGIQKKGGLRHRPGHLIDIMPTCLELAKASYPSTHKNHSIPPMEGASLVASFSHDENPERTLLWEHYDNRAIRRGSWKLVALAGKPWELYDVKVDRIEKNDVSSKHPQIAKELADLWEKEAHRTLIYPRPKSGK
jgi:arylsulfatase A-like enzyme